MPQEFQVLQCFSCKTFQVHQVKKAKKWVCKMCGEKQSVIKVYGRGTGAECRQHVQKLNTHRGELDSLKETWKLCEPSAISQSTDFLEKDYAAYSKNIQPGSSSNKWEQFVEDDRQQDELGLDENFVDERFTTDNSIFERQKKSKKRKRQSYIPVTDTMKVGKYEDFVEDQLEQEELNHTETFLTAQSNSSYVSHGTRGIYSTKCHRNSGNEKMSSSLSRWDKFQEYENNVDENFYDNSLEGDDEIDYNSLKGCTSGEKVDICEQLCKAPNPRRAWNSDDLSLPVTATVPVEQRGSHVIHQQTEGSKGRELLPDSVNKKNSKSLTSKMSKWGQFLDSETEFESESNSYPENSSVIGNSDRDLKTNSEICERTDFNGHKVSKSPNYPLQRGACQLKTVEDEFQGDTGSSCNQENRLKGNELINWRNGSKNDIQARTKVDTAFGNSYSQKENTSEQNQIKKISVFSAGELTDEDFEL